MGKTATVLAATSCGFILGSALTYFVYGRKKKKDADSSNARSIPGLRGTPRSARSIRSGDPTGNSGSGASASITKRSAYALARLAQHRGIDLEDMEHVGFLSSIMRELWPYVDKAGSAMVRDMMEPMFAEMLPGPLKTLKFIKLDLGHVPVQLDNVVVHKISDDSNSVQFDLDVIWDGECDIQMKSSYGLQFGVKSVKLSGRMSFLLCPLTEVLPVVSAIQYSFINPPDLELDFTGLAQVADFTIIDKTIRKMIQDIMAGMVVLPYRMLYKMDLASDYLKTYQPPLGIVNITIESGRGFVVEKGIVSAMDDIPDVYCLTEFGSNYDAPWRTRTIWDNLNPVWMESAMFVLSDYDQAIRIHAWEEDKSPIDPDDDLGTAEICIGDILVDGGRAEVELAIDEEMSGAFISLACQVLSLTTDDISSFDSDLCSGPNKLCGCLTIIVTKAFDIPLKVETAATFVKVTLDKQEFYTSVVTDYPGIDCLNPCYDASFMVPLTQDIVESASDVSGVVEFNLINGVDTILGTTTVALADLAKSPGMALQEKSKIGNGGASIEYRLTMYGVDTSNMIVPENAVESSSNVAPVKEIRARPLSPTDSVDFGAKSIPHGPKPGDMGSVRITAIRGRGFKVQKYAFKKDDVPDVYIKMAFGQNKQKFRTSTVKNAVAPVWGESTTFALNDHEDMLTIDVYDEDKVGDDYLGSAQISVSELMIAAKETELPLSITKYGKPQTTGAFVTVDCDVLGVELDSSFATNSSLGMSSSGSVDSFDSSNQGSLVFGSKSWHAA